MGILMGVLYSNLPTDAVNVNTADVATKFDNFNAMVKALCVGHQALAFFNLPMLGLGVRAGIT
jgi:hypothetical protein